MMKTRRQLLIWLRDARKAFRHHGRKSLSGKDAKKEIEAAENELRSRGIEIPVPGTETAEWERVTR